MRRGCSLAVKVAPAASIHQCDQILSLCLFAQSQLSTASAHTAHTAVALPHNPKPCTRNSLEGPTRCGRGLLVAPLCTFERKVRHEDTTQVGHPVDTRVAEE